MFVTSLHMCPRCIIANKQTLAFFSPVDIQCNTTVDVVNITQYFLSKNYKIFMSKIIQSKLELQYDYTLN